MTTDTQGAAKPVQMSADEIEVMEGHARDHLEGWATEMADDAEVRDVLEKAFEYRGDITLTRKDGSQVQGYLFDRNAGDTLDESFVRIIPNDGKPRMSIPYRDIAALAFTGRDNAAGKSFDAWVKKYWEKKAAGEKNIGIEAEELD